MQILLAKYKLLYSEHVKTCLKFSYPRPGPPLTWEGGEEAHEVLFLACIVISFFTFYLTIYHFMICNICTLKSDFPNFAWPPLKISRAPTATAIFEPILEVAHHFK